MHTCTLNHLNETMQPETLTTLNSIRPQREEVYSEECSESLDHIITRLSHGALCSHFLPRGTSKCSGDSARLSSANSLSTTPTDGRMSRTDPPSPSSPPTASSQRAWLMAGSTTSHSSAQRAWLMAGSTTSHSSAQPAWLMAGSTTSHSSAQRA